MIKLKHSDTLFQGGIFVITGFVFLPVFSWVLTQTYAQAQLTHAFIVFAFTGALIVIQNRIRLSLSLEFSAYSQALLCSSYLFLLLGSLTKWSPFFLLSMSLGMGSFLMWLFGTERKRLIFALTGAFTVFTGMALMLPVLDWPLRSIAGRCATAGLELVGMQTSLAMAQLEEPKLLLFSEGRPFHVAAECNGFGLITSSILMALILVLYQRRSLLGIITAIFLSTVLGFVFNSIRIVVIVLIAPKISAESYMLMHEIVGLTATYGGIGLLYWLLTKKV